MRTVMAVLLLMAVLLAATPLLAGPRTYIINADGKNAATFFYDDPVETVDGISRRLTGSITADPLDVAASTVEINVELAAIDTGLKMRDSHIREEFIQTSRFPRAAFKSAAVAAAQAKAIVPNQATEIQVTGDFSMHGVTKRMTIPVRVVLIPESELTRSSRGAGDWIHATAAFPLKLSEYGIEVPKSFMGDRIDVKLDVFAVAK